MTAVHDGLSSPARAGFTIIEVLIVVVVIAVLATITVVSYAGIREQAANSAMLATLDAWEKALLLSALNSAPLPASLNADLNPDLTTVVSETHIEVQTCLPADYQDTGTLPAGVCALYVQSSAATGEVMRIVWRENPALATELGTVLGSTMPEPRTDNIVSATATGAWEGDTITVTFTARGAMASVPGDRTHIGLHYYIQGEQVCGRGTGSVGALPDIFNLPEDGEQITFTAGHPLITSCTIRVTT